MKIYQFQKIVKDETQKIYLRNCNVVIDGQNYFHNVYENGKIPYIFGCETDKYATCLEEQMQLFKDANMKCYIVFKGGDTDIEEKLIKFKRFYFNVNTNNEFIPPLLLKDATTQVIDEIGVNYAFCVAEAKDECVALAEKLNCPVISNDIEFCYRKAPYISYKTMKFDKKTKSFRCQQYRLRDFILKYSLNEQKFAFFATLTDMKLLKLFPMNFFNSLFRNWRVSDGKGLIKWLSKHREQEARDGISSSLLTEEDRNLFWSNYNRILTNMRKDEGGHATEYLLNSNIPIVRQDPEWFEKGVVSKHVAPVYINLYKSNVIEGNWVILDEDSKDSLMLPVDIIKYAYNLLTNYKGGTFKVYQDTNKYVEIDTADTDVSRPNYDCELSVFENGWDHVKNLKLFEHFLAENDIDTEVLVDIPPESIILFIALVHFTRRKQLEGVDVRREVYAVVLTYFIVVTGEFLDIDENITNKYYQCKEDEAKRIFDGKALTTFMELQYYVQHMNYLNTLCGSPYESTQYKTSYNGTFAYKIFCDMRNQRIEDFVKESFNYDPILVPSAQVVIQDFRKLLNQQMFLLSDLHLQGSRF